jgi:hypothetical protein
MLLPTPTPAPIRPGTQTCQASDIKALLVGTNAATGGQLTATIVFGNRSGVPCVLEGLPGIQLFDAHGWQIPLTVSGSTDPLRVACSFRLIPRTSKHNPIERVARG